jgi:hypothetical protein
VGGQSRCRKSQLVFENQDCVRPTSAYPLHLRLVGTSIGCFWTSWQCQLFAMPTPARLCPLSLFPSWCRDGHLSGDWRLWLCRGVCLSDLILLNAGQWAAKTGESVKHKVSALLRRSPACLQDARSLFLRMGLVIATQVGQLSGMWQTPAGCKLVVGLFASAHLERMVRKSGPRVQTLPAEHVESVPTQADSVVVSPGRIAVWHTASPPPFFSWRWILLSLLPLFSSSLIEHRASFSCLQFCALSRIILTPGTYQTVRGGFILTVPCRLYADRGCGPHPPCFCAMQLGGTNQATLARVMATVRKYGRLIGFGEPPASLRAQAASLGWACCLCFPSPLQEYGRMGGEGPPSARLEYAALRSVRACFPFRCLLCPTPVLPLMTGLPWSCSRALLPGNEEPHCLSGGVLGEGALLPLARICVWLATSV